MSAERAVLGTVLQSSGSVLDDLTLSPDDFVEPALGEVYRLAQSMWHRHEPVDLITLSERARDKQLVTELFAEPVVVASASFYARDVAEAALRRRIAAAAGKVSQEASSFDIDALVDAAHDVAKVADGFDDGAVEFMPELIEDAFEQAQQPDRFVPTPWRTLNEMLGGFRPGALYVIGARPGVGKSVMAVQSALELAGRGAVAFVSLEMSRNEVFMRAFQAETGTTSSQVADPSDTVADRQQRFKDMQIPLAVCDRAGMTIHDVRRFTRAVNRRKPIAGVVVDYLQLMRSSGDKPRHEQVAEMSRELKILAKDLAVPVIALSQLNRGEGRPDLRNLRESGAIEQDADVVLLLDREITNPMSDLEVAVAKNRHGESGMVTLEWQGAFYRAQDRR